MAQTSVVNMALPNFFVVGAMKADTTTPEIRRMRVDEHRDDNASVEKLLDRDLSAWTT